MSTREINSPFGQNVFIVNHQRKHLFVSTAKSGCTTLKFLTLIDSGQSKKGLLPQQSHNILGYKANDNTLISTSSKKFPEYTRLAVLRDPIKRFISWHNDKIANPYQPYIFQSGLANETNVERCLTFLEFELSKSDPEWMDEHVRPQSMYFNSDDIDVFVNLSDLTAYLETIGIKKQYRSSNKSKKQNVELTEVQKHRLKILYNSDYKLLKTVADKVWKP